MITSVAQFAMCCLVDLPRLGLEGALRVAVVASTHTQTHTSAYTRLCLCSRKLATALPIVSVAWASSCFMYVAVVSARECACL